MFNAVDAWPALALLALVLMLPWAASWVRRRGWVGLKQGGQPLQVVSVVAVGPQQKVVTVELDLGTTKKWLVLGVTPQSVNRLDTFEKPTDLAPLVPAAHAHEARH